MTETLHSTTWDRLFKEAALQYLPGIDWRWLKAQCYQESAFNAEAVSPAGAQGMMQIMPGTWSDLVNQGVVDLGDSPFNDRASVIAGAAYMAQLKKKWWWERPPIDQYALTLASYNAGLGNVVKAQKVVHDGTLYSDVIKGLPDITGTKNSQETITYVQKIFNHYRALVLGG